MRRVFALALIVMLTAVAVPVARARTQHPVWVGRYAVDVHGQQADGWLAYPTDVEPDTLLVFGHGCCVPLPRKDAEQLALHHARDNGMAVVVMDYRGRSGHWNVGFGKADLIAATVDLQQRFHVKRTVAWGVSMGGEVTGMAVAARPDLFDYWISSAGVLDLPTQWAQQTYRAEIEAETQGTPATARARYDRRSPTALAPKMHGIIHAYLLHGVGDTAVPSSESQQMFDALRKASVPVSSYTITTAQGDASLWWPVIKRASTPVWVAGHDWSAIALGQRILLAIAAGRAPDAHEAASSHVWDDNAEVMTP